jgi:hypothetical protein
MVELRLDPRLRARVDPSDVVQEAHLEAARRLQDDAQPPPMPFRLWLRQLASDRLLMLRRYHLAAARRSVYREIALPERSSMQLFGQFLASGLGHDDKRCMSLRRRGKFFNLAPATLSILGGALMHNKGSGSSNAPALGLRAVWDVCGRWQIMTDFLRKRGRFFQKPCLEI